MGMHWLTSMNLINQLSTNIYIYICMNINLYQFISTNLLIHYTIAPFPSCFPPSQRWDLSLPSGSTWRCWRRWSKTSGQFTAICVVDIWVLCGAWTSDTSCTLRGRKETCQTCPGVAINKQKWWFSILRTEKVVYTAKMVIQWWFHQRKRWFNQVKRWLNQLEPWFNRDILVMRWFNGRYILWAIGPKNKFNEQNLAVWDFIDITLDYVSIPIKTIFWEVNIHKSQLPMHLLLKLWGQGRLLNKMQTINWGNADFFIVQWSFMCFTYGI